MNEDALHDVEKSNLFMENANLFLEGFKNVDLISIPNEIWNTGMKPQITVMHSGINMNSL